MVVKLGDDSASTRVEPVVDAIGGALVVPVVILAMILSFKPGDVVVLAETKSGPVVMLAEISGWPVAMLAMTSVGPVAMLVVTSVGPVVVVSEPGNVVVVPAVTSGLPG